MAPAFRRWKWKGRCQPTVWVCMCVKFICENAVNEYCVGKEDELFCFSGCRKCVPFKEMCLPDCSLDVLVNFVHFAFMSLPLWPHSCSGSDRYTLHTIIIFLHCSLWYLFISLVVAFPWSDHECYISIVGLKVHYSH